jgi:hypothetical protein
MSVRDITPDEAAFFRDHGWVHVPGLVKAEVASALAAGAEAALRGSTYKSFTGFVDDAFRLHHRPDRTNPLAREAVLSPACGRNGARLLRGGPAIRLLQSSYAAKWGGADPEPMGPTPFHQDYPAWALDRSEMFTVWVALVEVTPDMGTMRFADGSHRFGALGRSFVRADDDLFSQHPWLRDLPLSPPLTLRPGDATIHHGLTVHGAPHNATPRPRLSIQAVYGDASALYNGARLNPRWETLGLTLHAPLDHPDFPLVPA